MTAIRYFLAGLTIVAMCGADEAANPARGAQPEHASTLASFESVDAFNRFFRRRWESYFDRVRASTREIRTHPTVGASVPVQAAEETTIVATRLEQRITSVCCPGMMSVTTEDHSPKFDIVTVHDAGAEQQNNIASNGDILVVMRRGKLFTILLANGGMKPVDSIAAHPMGEAMGSNDHMFVTQGRVILVSYDFGVARATEVTRFRLSTDGRIAFEDSSALSAMRSTWKEDTPQLIGDRLILSGEGEFHPASLHPLSAAPGIGAWRGVEQPAFAPIAGARRVYYAPGYPDGVMSAIHSVVSCDVTSIPLACSTVSVLAPEFGTRYSTPTADYVWTLPGWDAFGHSAPRLLRFPLDGGAPSAVGVSGDSIGFREDDGVLNFVLVNPYIYAPTWDPQNAVTDSMALLRLPKSEFGDGSHDVDASRYRMLPKPERRDYYTNRFLGDYLLYASNYDWLRHPQPHDGIVMAIPVNGGQATRFHVPDAPAAFGNVGPDAIITGESDGHTYLRAIRLGATPTLGDRFVMSGDAGSYSFNARYDGNSATGGATGVLAMAVERYQRVPNRRPSIALIFLRRATGHLTPMSGELVARTDGGLRDDCSDCGTAWFGNTQALFLADRTYGLMGYELVEARLDAKSVHEIRRVDFGSVPTEPSWSQPLAVANAFPTPPRPGDDPRWIYDPASSCWIWTPPDWGQIDDAQWLGPCEHHLASHSGTLLADRGKGPYLRVRGAFVKGGPHGELSIESISGADWPGDFEDHRIGNTILRTDGARDTGVFADGKLNGSGARVWPNGMRYEGEFANNVFEGRGTIIWPGGDRYTGTFKNGVEDGPGTFKWRDGSTLTCMFKQGEIVGTAKLRRPGGIEIENTIVQPRADPKHPDLDATYPSLALRLNEEGRVVVAFRVTITGDVDSVYVLNSSGRGWLDKAALDAMVHTRRLPATIGNVPIAVKSTRLFRFVLH